MPYIFALTVFTQRNFVADFVRRKSYFLYKKWPVFAVKVPLGGLGAMYTVHLRLTGKLVVDFLLVIIELFSLGAFVVKNHVF